MVEAFAIALITEIMYNPASNEQPPVQTEWVEIYNPGDTAIDLAGWYLRDEDGRTAGIPDATTLAPGEAAVLIPAEQSVEDFQAAWGTGFQVIPLANWSRGGMGGLANSPSATNEILSLCRSDGSSADVVNYDDQRPWPSDSPDGSSIYLLPGQIDAAANDDGANWRRAELDVHGARHALATADYVADDLGSPGLVVTETATAAANAPAAEE